MVTHRWVKEAKKVVTWVPAKVAATVSRGTRMVATRVSQVAADALETADWLQTRVTGAAEPIVQLSRKAKREATRVTTDAAQTLDRKVVQARREATRMTNEAARTLDRKYVQAKREMTEKVEAAAQAVTRLKNKAQRTADDAGDVIKAAASAAIPDPERRPARRSSGRKTVAPASAKRATKRRGNNVKVKRGQKHR